jgi:DNA-binding transcriptional LysR family regulator
MLKNGTIMAQLTFDLDVLRTFVTGVDMGSFAKAADRLGRSTSAVSAQLKKLEDQLGMPVLRKEGRGMVTTSAGEALLGYARRLLELNDEAATAVRGAELAGSVRLGLQEDFGEHLLTEVLGRFARVHPKLRIEARVARNVALMEQMAGGRLDLVLAWDSGASAGAAASLAPLAGMPLAPEITRLPLRWIGASNSPAPLPDAVEPLPLVMMEAPCMMRSQAIAALDAACIPWRIAFSSPSLGGVWAAVAAGLGVTVRTGLVLPRGVLALEGAALPALPVVGLRLHRAEAQLSAPAQRLHDIVLEALAPLTADLTSRP